MKGYKGFSKGLICKDKQYAENTIFEEDAARICECGMHFCESPLDVLDHYPLIGSDGELNEFAEVEALGDVKTDDNRKFCTDRLKVGAKITIPRLGQLAGEFLREKITHEAKSSAVNGGDYAQQVGGGNAIMVSGEGSRYKAGLHSLLIAYWYDKDGNLAWKAAQIDGEVLKPDTWYTLKDGEFVEAEG